MPEIQMYTTARCGYCHAAASLLDREGLAFEQIDVTTDAEARDALAARTGRTTVPQIFIHGRAIGGFEELRELVRRGDLTDASRRHAA